MCNESVMAQDPIKEGELIAWRYPRKRDVNGKVSRVPPGGRECYYCGRTRRADARCGMFFYSIVARANLSFRIDVLPSRMRETDYM